MLRVNNISQAIKYTQKNLTIYLSIAKEVAAATTHCQPITRQNKENAKELG